ncbi:MFS transporter [Sulfuriferula sp. GW1]|uniref:MFS transporter n=1 Tax=Sulfuriferula sp. GW1 TaxID=3345111 RepID=UPI0039B063DA
MGNSPISVRQRSLTLAATSLGFVVVLLDVSVVNVALQRFQVVFGASVTGLQWVVNAYTLTFAALLLTGGALGDRLGSKRVFVAGFALFTVASLGCGLAPTLTILVVARIFQGLGAALLVPASLSVLHQSYPDPAERSKAVGLWASAGGIALAAGPVLGGVLIVHIGWRSIFLVNFPIGLLGIWLTLRNAPPTYQSRSKGLDIAGQAAAILALGGLTAAIIEAGPLGWDNHLVTGCLILSLLASTSFLYIETTGKAPMLPLSLFRNATFSVASVIGVIVNFAFYGLVFVFSLYFQSIQHYSPLQTGLAFLPMTAVIMVGNIIAGNLTAKVGPRPLMVVGLLTAAIGYLTLMPVMAGAPYHSIVLPLLVAGSGIALTVPPMTSASLSAVDHSRAGIASGVLNSARQVGGVFGVAVFGFLVRDERPESFMAGMHMSLVIAVVLLASGSVMSFFGVTSRPGGLIRVKAKL